MTYVQGNDETPDYSAGYADGLKGRAHNCPAGLDDDLYTEGYEAGQEASLRKLHIFLNVKPNEESK